MRSPYRVGSLGCVFEKINAYHVIVIPFYTSEDLTYQAMDEINHFSVFSETGPVFLIILATANAIGDFVDINKASFSVCDVLYRRD